MGKIYKSWADFPAGDWRWPAFLPQEMASRGDGELMIDAYAMDCLQLLRSRLGKPMIVNSAYRSERHNTKVGGAKNSQHRLAKAFDIRMENHDPQAFERLARECGFKGIGHYPKQGFMHIDVGPARRWNDGGWFPTGGATPSFQPEPKRETVKAALLKPEIVTAVAAPVVTGAATIAQGDGPMQYALAAILVLGAVLVAGIVIAKTMRRRVAD